MIMINLSIGLRSCMRRVSAVDYGGLGGSVQWIYLELSADAGWLLLLVQVQRGLGGSIVQCESHDEFKGTRVKEYLHEQGRHG